MASKVAPASSQTISAATAGSLVTVTSTTDIWPGSVGYITKAGQPDRRVEVTEVQSGTVIKLRMAPKIDDDDFGINGSPSGNSGFDVSAYSGGRIAFDEQLVEANPDYSKPAFRL